MNDDSIKQMIQVFQEGSDQLKSVIDVINKYLAAVKDMKAASTNIVDMVAKLPTLDNDLIFSTLKQMSDNFDKLENKLIKRVDNYHKEEMIALQKIMDEQLKMTLAVGNPGIKSQKTKANKAEKDDKVTKQSSSSSKKKDSQKKEKSTADKEVVK